MAAHHPVSPPPLLPVLARFVAAVTVLADDEAESLVVDLQAPDAPLLAEMAQTGDTNVRWWAIRALAAIAARPTAGAEPPVSTLLNRAALAALDDPDPSLRAVAALALAEGIRAKPAGETTASTLLTNLAQHLGDEDGFVRQAAADALAQCGDTAIPALGSILAGTHEGARARAAYALRKIATYKAAALLFPLLNDPHPLVRAYAQEGLDDMGLLENMLLIP
jgi:HEAT repeat protein